MRKYKNHIDNDLDIVKLINKFFQVLSKNIKKIFLFGIVGFLCGVLVTYFKTPQYKTAFKVHIGHPAFDEEILFQSSELQTILNDSELNYSKLPKLTFNPRTKIFTIYSKYSNEPDIQHKVISILNNSLTNELNNLKEKTSGFKGIANIMVISKKNLVWLGEAITNLNNDQIIQTLKISFGETKVIHPRPLKYGIIFLVLGVFLSVFIIQISSFRGNK